MMVKISQRIKELRSLRGLSQDELAKYIGVGKSTISMYENEQRVPSPEVQEALADYFNVDLDYLVGRSNRTTVVLPANGAEPQRRYLMDKIAKADPAKLRKLEKLIELIDDEEARNY